MQKFINFLAVTSFVISGSIVTGGVLVYLNKDAIVENVKGQVVNGVKEALPGLIRGALPVALDGGVTDGDLEVPSSPPVEVPSFPF